VLADLGQRQATILLHHGQNLAVDVIEIRVLFA
jgi:hypothetical protein